MSFLFFGNINMQISSIIINQIPKKLLKALFFILFFSDFVYSKDILIPDCEFMASVAEEKYDLPVGILSSISNVEAGRITKGGQKRGWPWTVNHAGEGLFFESSQDAIAYVNEALQSGDLNLDVGCMQISLKWHSINFETLDLAFNPYENIEYAAQFLNNLFISHGSWEQAIKHYHSSDPKKNIKYHKKVLAAWSENKHKKYFGSSLENMLVKTNLLLPISKPDFNSLNKKIQLESKKSKTNLNSSLLSNDFKLTKVNGAEKTDRPKTKENKVTKHKSKFIVDRWELVLSFREQLSK